MAKLQRFEVKCIEPDCGAIRLVHRASVREVKRCFKCQEENKRRKGRERYRRRKNQPLEDPETITPEIKEETRVKITHENVRAYDPPPVFVPRVKDESAEMQSRIESVLDLLDDDSTEDDW